MSTEHPLSALPVTLAQPSSAHTARPAKHERIPYRASIGLALLRRARLGCLILRDPSGEEHRFGRQEPPAGATSEAEPALWILRDWSVFDRALTRGDVGFGECWMEGLWDSPDPAAVLRFMLMNRESLDQGIYGTWIGQWVDRLRHLLRRNSRSGSRRNIQAHYDLGNDFYQLWLDPSMTYSSAMRSAHADEQRGSSSEHAQSKDGCKLAPCVVPIDALEIAQHRKYETILDALALAPGSSVLEIGCGWGGFALRARRRDLHMKCLTLSSEQLRYAQELHQVEQTRQGSGFGSARFCLQDYRDEQDHYDGIVSIEMFEAVGEAYWDSYFARIRHCLKPGAKAVIQSITIDEKYFQRYRAGTDFIQQYIFPGGMLPSPERLIAVAHAQGLKLCDSLRFGADYAWTLARWHERFIAADAQVRALGYDERFIRMWRFYLAYCEAGFAEGGTDVMQFSFTRA